MWYTIGNRIETETGSIFCVSKIDGYLRVIFIDDEHDYIVEPEKYNANSIVNVISINRLQEIMNKYSDYNPSYKGKKIFKNNKNICYKVVLPSGNNNYVSCSAIYASLDYKINKITKPKFGKIFVFKQKNDALNFMKMSRTLMLLKCECSAMSPILDLTSPLYSEQTIKEFWSKPRSGCGEIPTGTFGVDWIKPIEVV